MRVFGIIGIALLLSGCTVKVDSREASKYALKVIAAEICKCSGGVFQAQRTKATTLVVCQNGMRALIFDTTPEVITECEEGD